MRKLFVGFRASEELIRSIDEAAGREGRTRSGMIKRILGEHCEAKTRLDLSAGQAVELREALEANHE